MAAICLFPHCPIPSPEQLFEKTMITYTVCTYFLDVLEKTDNYDGFRVGNAQIHHYNFKES